MGKRKPSKPKKHALRAKVNLSSRSYKNLKREAENARRRIKAFTIRPDSDNYLIPDVSDYTLVSLMERLAAGETTRHIMRELKNLTAEKIKTGIPVYVVSATGYQLKPAENRRIIKAVSEANQNIRQARQKFADFTEILPQEFSARDLVQNATSSESIENKINDLALFTPENLIPTAVNDDGEAGTVAEYQYYRNILERENERRAQIRAENDPRTNKGFFRQQSDYDSEDINIDAISSMDTLRKRAETWDDPARIYRANMYLTNYEKALDMFAGVLINNGYWNDVIEERIEYIRDVIGRLYFNEKAITFASTRMPNIDISLLYGGGNGDFDFASIYDAWCDIEDMYL